uniref:Uncharacterized protein n=1 Tax=Anopheles dirus TaxID=7168 RepID=A0A182NVX4_9DIPT
MRKLLVLSSKPVATLRNCTMDSSFVKNQQFRWSFCNIKF